VKIGFTGTRVGMTTAQRLAFRSAIEANKLATHFHHGCCVGADDDAAFIVYELRHGRVSIVGHPPDKMAMIAERSLGTCDEVYDPLPYIDRNHRIVDRCDVLVACPGGPEKLRSGTWATVRYARKQGKRVVIVWPDGKVTEEERASAA
jgi:hypothetical protein